MNIISVLLAMGAAWLVSVSFTHLTAWVVAPFVAGIVYLVIESLEAALAERILVRSGDLKAPEVSGQGQLPAASRIGAGPCRAAGSASG